MSSYHNRVERSGLVVPLQKIGRLRVLSQRLLYHDGDFWIVRIADCHAAMAILNDGVNDRPFFGVELEERCLFRDGSWEVRLEKTLILHLPHHTVHFSLLRQHTEGPTRLILRHDEPAPCEISRT